MYTFIGTQVLKNLNHTSILVVNSQSGSEIWNLKIHESNIGVIVMIDKFISFIVTRFGVAPKVSSKCVKSQKCY